MAKKTSGISARAERAWQRLTDWYGARLAESYGKVMPADWAKVIDATDNDTVKRGLSLIRSRYVQHPPTLPQFDQAMRPPEGTTTSGPNPAERLCAHVMRHYGGRLTEKQTRGPWTYIGTPGGEISGVVIDGDVDHAGYRVMLADLEAPDFTPQPPLLRLV